MVNGPVFGSKDLFSGLAIIADTYSNHNGPHNHNHPYLSAMVNNGSLSYDHDRDGTHTMLGGCEVKFRNMEHETLIAIRYEEDKLTVSHDLSNRRAWEPCFSIGMLYRFIDRLRDKVLFQMVLYFQQDTILEFLLLLETSVIITMLLV